ncbi:MAG: acyl-CoA reductase, partial [Thermoanaerobaculia bacterium]|nr:acyl-CoA reductase [Thermoanaerobaculia bacterium]
PSPGRRTIRVHPLDDLRELPRILAPWKGRLQGAALAGERARELEPALRELGVTRCALPGELQTPDQRWQNGGRDLIGVL